MPDTFCPPGAVAAFFLVAQDHVHTHMDGAEEADQIIS